MDKENVWQLMTAMLLTVEKQAMVKGSFPNSAVSRRQRIVVSIKRLIFNVVRTKGFVINFCCESRLKKKKLTPTCFIHTLIKTEDGRLCFRREKFQEI